MTEVFRMGKGGAWGLGMNWFMFVAVVAGEWGYLDDGDRRLPVWINGKFSDEVVVTVDIGCSLPPDGELEKGEEITVAGTIAAVDGRLVPRVMEITRNGQD
jgi:hypothetical protein